MRQETRQLEVARSSEKDGLTFAASVSSEYPVERAWGWEVLSHASRAVDLSRAADGLPLLVGHDMKDPVGMASGFRLEGDRLKATVRFFSTERGREFATMAAEGLRGISIGYTLDDLHQDGERDGVPVYRAAKWTPYEISVAPVAADPTVGIGRARQTLTLNRGNRTMENENVRVDDALNADRERVQQILALASKHGQEALAQRFIAQGRSLEDFRDVVETIARQAPPVREQLTRPIGSQSRSGLYSSPAEAIGLDAHIMRDYSLIRAIRAQADPKFAREAGFELEVSDQLQRISGRRTKSLAVPLDALTQRAITKAGSGGNLIAEDHRADMFIDVLRARSFVMQHATVIGGLQGDVVIPKKLSGGGAAWFEGDDTDAITETTQTFGQVSLTPNVVGALTTISRKALVQSSLDMENLVKQDFTDALGVEIDKQAIQGTGAGYTPTGVVNTSGVGALEYANGSYPDYADIVAMETELALANADFGNLRFLAHPLVAGGLKVTERAANTGQFVWNTALEGQGTMHGYPAFISNNVPAGTVIFGNWKDLLVGTWGIIELDVDPYGSNFAKGSLSVHALMVVDLAIRHPESFVVLTEAAA